MRFLQGHSALPPPPRPIRTPPRTEKALCYSLIKHPFLHTVAMAPHVVPSSPTMEPQDEVYDINVPFKESASSKEHYTKSKYPQYLPTWEKVFFPPCPEFDFVDPALRADITKPNLLQPGVKVTPLSPKMGTELHGIQLTQMSDDAKDELALLVSERKCVVLRDQNFAEWGPAKQQEFASKLPIQKCVCVCEG